MEDNKYFIRIELQRMSGIQELQSITKTRPIFYTFIVLLALVVIPLGIAKGFTRKGYVLGE
jgi:hypothetical protein